MTYDERKPTNYDEFLTVVEQHARIGRERAERATQATLETLAERIAAGQASDLIAELPDELGAWLATDTDAQRFDVSEFIRRVAEREGVDPETAELHAAAVFDAVERTVSDKEFDDLIAQLPREYARLLPRAPASVRAGGAVSADTFLERVADRAATDAEGARRATDAVLETLAERIAAGEVDDLIARLPVELHRPLTRGRGRGGGKATPMSLEEFVSHVAEREGIDEEQARDHARAVLRTLREAVGDDEFFDVTVQLPSEYQTVLAG